MNYIFYDFETSGLNYYFDQPIQLAAKLVDENFSVIDELNEKCRLRDGVIPSPTAMLITKTDLEDLNTKQSFYEFMDKVHKKLTSWSPAIFIGYNNINFDEKFLRSSFYQSLYAPYLTNTNNNMNMNNILHPRNIAATRYTLYDTTQNRDFAPKKFTGKFIGRLKMLTPNFLET